MKKLWALAITGVMAVLVGCSEPTEVGEASDVTTSLAGEAFYRERLLLPPGAELLVTLEDVSKMDVASTVIAAATHVLT